MTDTDLLRSQRLTSRLATGYRLRSDGAAAVTDRQGVTAAAGSIYSTPRDMARYVAALLGGGSGEHGSILKPETVALMFEPHYRPDPRIPGMGLAFWRADLGGHPAVEHQGVVPGFNSQIFLAPDDGVGVMAFTNGSRNASGWLTGETESAAPGADRRPGAGHPDRRPAAPGDLGQALRLVPAPRPADRHDGVGHARRRSSGHRPARPADPANRQSDTGAVPGPPVASRRARKTLTSSGVDLSKYGLGTVRVVFSRDPSGMTTGVHLDGLLLSAEKHPGRPLGLRYARRPA